MGICWTANNLISNITTGAGPALTGNWGLYAIPHGSYTDPDESCPLPGECGDGWQASAIEGEFIAMGGWVETNTPFAKLGIYLGDYPANPVDLGETCDPPDSENCASNSVVTTQHQFWGVIEPAGFLSPSSGNWKASLKSVVAISSIFMPMTSGLHSRVPIAFSRTDSNRKLRH